MSNWKSKQTVCNERTNMHEDSWGGKCQSCPFSASLKFALTMSQAVLREKIYSQQARRAEIASTPSNHQKQRAEGRHVRPPDHNRNENCLPTAMFITQTHPQKKKSILQCIKMKCKHTRLGIRRTDLPSSFFINLKCGLEQGTYDMSPLQASDFP